MEGGEPIRMTRDVAPVTFRPSPRALTEERCEQCHRTPLIGEVVHLLESGRQVCTLCVGHTHARHGEPISSKRVRATERPLAVVARAA